MEPKQLTENAGSLKPLNVVNQYYGPLHAGRLLMNALFLIWRAIDIDNNDAAKLQDADAIYLIVPFVFILFFSGAIALRLIFDMTIKEIQLKESLLWCSFDMFFTFLLLVEFCAGCAGMTDGYNVLYSLQVIRVGVFLTPSVAPELAILVKGLFVASRSVFFCIVLHVLMTFGFALVFAKCSRGYPELMPYFEDVPEAMHTLLVYGVVFDIAQLSYVLQSANGFFELLMVFYCLFNFVLLVIIAGVICEVLSTVASSEKDVMVEKYLLDRIHGELRRLGINDCEITKANWDEIMKSSREIRQIMYDIGVDLNCLTERNYSVFAKGKAPAEKIAQAILRSRPSEKATVKDIVMQTKDLQRLGSLAGSADQVSKIESDESLVKRAVADCLQPVLQKLQAQEKMLARMMASSQPLPGLMAST
jgi:hypothetical protein